MLPTQGPLFQPTPVTILSLSLFDSLANAALALVYEAAQAPSPLPDPPEPDGAAALEVLEEAGRVEALVGVAELGGALVLVEVAFVLVASVVDAAPGMHCE